MAASLGMWQNLFNAAISFYAGGSYQMVLLAALES